MDIESLLKSLNVHDVSFVIIGATAFPVYGYSRSTLDIDIFIKPDPDNAEKTYEALKAFGYDMSDIEVNDLLNNKVLIRQHKIETDIHPFVKGITFEEVWGNKIEGEIGKNKVYFASLENLIKMKEAAGRPKDMEDVKILKRLLKKNKNAS